MSEKLNAADLENIVMEHCYRKRHNMVISHFSISAYESDVFSINRTGTTFEHEIKTSRADFFGEFKKKGKKHKWLEDKKFRVSPKSYNIPQYFSFFTPQEMVQPEEVPHYAGLYYIATNEYMGAQIDWIYCQRLQQPFKIIEVRRPKKIHSNKANEWLLAKVATSHTHRMMGGSKLTAYRAKYHNTLDYAV